MGFNFGSNTAKAYLGDVEIAGGGGNQPTLNAPTISISSGVLTITPSQNNGNFASGTFKIYAGSTLIATQSAYTFDLQDYMETEEWEEGTYSITASESGTNFIDGVSSAVSFVFAYPVPATAYVKFLGTEAFTLQNPKGKYYNGSVEYSTNNANWNTWDGTSTISSSQSAPFELYLKGTGNTHFATSNDYYTQLKIVSTNPVECSGNIMALLDYASVESETSITMDQWCFGNLFYQSNISSAPQLPTTTLSAYCYYGMFYGCSSLTTPPQLPALTMVDTCYGAMFKDCTSLTTPPSLPATNIYSWCYAEMFAFCTSLTTAPQLPSIDIQEDCYVRMFQGCSSLIVSDTQTSEATHQWRIPQEYTFWNSKSQTNMFAGCQGTRSSNNMAGASGQAYTYYTQNEPV